MQELLDAYPVIIEIPIAWGDMDAFQHVNNTVYFRHFESARLAYFEKIGTMQVTEEVDALRSMGIPPMDLLVLPKLLALIVALPLLTVFADIMGVLGGMVTVNFVPMPMADDTSMLPSWRVMMP